MALDVGDRRIGVALSDPTGLLATPLTAVDRLDARPSEFDEIISLAQENDVEAIIVGMPVTLAGRLGHQARQVRDFISELSDHTDLAIETVDERYSTVQRDPGHEGDHREEGKKIQAKEGTSPNSALQPPATSGDQGC